MFVIALSLAVAAASPLQKFLADNEITCIGKADFKLDTAAVFSSGPYNFSVTGGTASVHAANPGTEARLGLLAAVKDFSPETKANLEQFLTQFRKAGVNGLVVDGDSAYGADDQDGTLADLFGWLGSQGLPVYAVIGNSESRSAFNRALAAAPPNVLNLDLIRRVEIDGATLISLPGYYDARYIAESAGCRYSTEDAQELPKLARGAVSPVVLISHGPPRQQGKLAIDAAADGRNVGDPDLADAISQAKIPFGVFGHILEAGGRATDLAGTHPVRPGVASTSLYVNPGPAFADPWGLNGGGVSHGMAAILILKDGKGQWLPVKAGAPDPRARNAKYTQ
jgi:Icc-related predicted phosphoesterase